MFSSFSSSFRHLHLPSSSSWVSSPLRRHPLPSSSCASFLLHPHPHLSSSSYASRQHCFLSFSFSLPHHQPHLSSSSSSSSLFLVCPPRILVPLPLEAPPPRRIRH